MAQDIVPIELGLPQGDLVTLWAPKWREDGEEWEAFLGHGEDLYGFADAAHLAAYLRKAQEHDLTDHPAWAQVPGLHAGELIPDDEHRFDLVGVPELVAEEPDTWTIGELAETVAIVRSLADVCELDAVHEVLDSADGFALLNQGTYPFQGRDGEARWNDLAKVVIDEWDKVLDAIDAVVTQPEVDEAALTVAQAELDELETEEEDAAEGEQAEVEEEAPTGFWAEVGIDPIKIITSVGEHYTLRCYLDDKPVFLGSEGQIDVFGTPRALARFLATGEGDSAEDHANDLSAVVTWEDVVAAATNGDLEIEVEQDNTYVLTGLSDDLAGGVEQVDPYQLELAVELITDAAQWAGDESAEKALTKSESLGWLVSFVIRPDPNRLAPSAPFTAEVESWEKLVAGFEERLRAH
ncbi:MULTISPECIES: primosomal protein [unclassified Crossiella]|uniref:primosomal protein n=1 Tax=unclassified Crossiella TaxID=2620835 RepID=UPI001FFF4FBE|nr:MULTISPECIES: primosomal protein [unclassified Crossiella]MCK2238308.1 primosomal protein [Crossiella sp. S99.2]MCK2256348.1 primosomal protein [Crossiella sp. S99.1]